MWAQKQCLLFLSYENTWAIGILNTKKPIMHPNYIKQVLKSGHALDADTSIMHE